MTEPTGERVERCDMTIVCEPDRNGHRKVIHVDSWWRSPRAKITESGPGSPTDALYRKGMGW